MKSRRASAIASRPELVFGQDLYDYVSGEIRYLYQDGHPFLSGDGVRSDIQGQSHALTYDLLFHFRDRSHRFRPFLEGGLGVKDYVIAGPTPSPQAFPNIAILTTADEWKFATTVGGGVKYGFRSTSCCAWIFSTT